MHCYILMQTFIRYLLLLMQDLLTMNEELKKARKAFDEIKYVQEATQIYYSFLNCEIIRAKKKKKQDIGVIFFFIIYILYLVTSE